MSKYDDIDFKPPKGAANAAKKALKWREEHGDEVDAGTTVSIKKDRRHNGGN